MERSVVNQLSGLEHSVVHQTYYSKLQDPFARTEIGVRMVESTISRQSRISNLPSHNCTKQVPPLHLLIFQAIEITRLNQELEAVKNRLYIRERDLATLQNHEVQVRELTERLYAADSQLNSTIYSLESYQRNNKEQSHYMRQRDIELSEATKLLKDKYEWEVTLWRKKYEALERSSNDQIQSLKRGTLASSGQGLFTFSSYSSDQQYGVSSQVQELRSKLICAETEINSLKELNYSLQATLSTASRFEMTITDLERTNRTLTQHVLTLKSEVTSWEQRYQMLQADHNVKLIQFEEQIAMAKSQQAVGYNQFNFEQSYRDYSHYGHKQSDRSIEQMENQIVLLGSQVSRLHDQLEQQRVDSRKYQQSSTVNIYEEENRRMKSENHQLSVSLEESMQAYRQIQGTLEHCTQEIQNLRAQTPKQDWLGTLQTLKRSIWKLEQELSAKQTQLDSLKAKLDQFRQVGTVLTQFNELQESHETIMLEFMRTKQEQSSQIALLEQKESKILQFSRLIESREFKIEEMAAEITLKNSKIASFEEQTLRLSSEIRQIRETRTTHQQELSRVTSMISRYESEVTVLKERNAALEIETSSLKHELSQSSSRVSLAAVQPLDQRLQVLEGHSARLRIMVQGLMHGIHQLMSAQGFAFELLKEVNVDRLLQIISNLTLYESERQQGQWQEGQGISEKTIIDRCNSAQSMGLVNEELKQKYSSMATLPSLNSPHRSLPRNPMSMIVLPVLYPPENSQFRQNVYIREIGGPIRVSPSHSQPRVRLSPVRRNVLLSPQIGFQYH